MPTKKEVNKMKTRQPRRSGRSRRGIVLEISIFCAFLFQTLLKDVSGNIYDAYFSWWAYGASFVLLIWKFVVVINLLWDVFGYGEELMSVMVTFMVFLMVFYCYALRMSKLLVAVMIEWLVILKFSVQSSRDGPQVIMAYFYSLFNNG
jgi:hypothetical protein